MIKCPFCKYEWRPRVDRPKSCPECKKRFKWVVTSDGLVTIVGKSGGVVAVTSAIMPAGLAENAMAEVVADAYESEGRT